tara:strand:- start:2806 stop:3339 length:534 start_codon:yes stop_codon:yes gene_type:complete
MAAPDYKMGPVSSFEAISEGAPGNRTFYLNAKSLSGNAKIWVEKEQLNTLIMGFERIFRLIDDQKDKDGMTLQNDSNPELQSENGNLDLDVKSGNMSIRYDQESALIELIVYGEMQDEDQHPVVTLLLSKKIAENFVDNGLEVYGAGRSTCPLCESPINPGENHICPRSNGHSAALS